MRSSSRELSTAMKRSPCYPFKAGNWTIRLPRCVESVTGTWPTLESGLRRLPHHPTSPGRFAFRLHATYLLVVLAVARDARK